MSDSDDRWLKLLRGRFIVFDGPDGSGKTTQFQRFARFLETSGVRVCQVREPGGTPIGEQVRRVLLDPENAEMDVRCEMLLYMASRAQLVSRQIKPALVRGELVLADRYVSSTLAYQGAAGGLSQEEILSVAKVAVGECWPDVVVVFDVDPGTAANRLGPDKDRVEQKDQPFHQAVRKGYLDQARKDPSRYLVIDASPDPGRVFDALVQGLRTRFSR